MAEDQTIPDAEAQEEQDDKRERSKIAFPYSDLKEAVTVAQAVWDNVGAGNCELAQLGPWLKHDSITSGAFRLKVAAAKTFGLIETNKGVRLTRLGREIVDPQLAEAAKVTAFLTVPLYKAVYDKYSGTLLPNNVGLEREMADMGVAAKQTDKARQAFQRSAQEAGFFKEGNNKLVRPGLQPQETPTDEKDKDKDKGSGGPPPPTMHPFIKGLVDTLPPAGRAWTEEGQDQWLTAAKAIFKLIYPVASAPPLPDARSLSSSQD